MDYWPIDCEEKGTPYAERCHSPPELGFLRTRDAEQGPLRLLPSHGSWAVLHASLDTGLPHTVRLSYPFYPAFYAGLLGQSAS